MGQKAKKVLTLVHVCVTTTLYQKTLHLSSADFFRDFGTFLVYTKILILLKYQDKEKARRSVTQARSKLARLPSVARGG